MSIFMYPVILIAALTAKAGAFSFYLGRTKYTVTVVETIHTLPLGGFNLAQAASLAGQIATGTGTGTVRIGADDYTFTVSH